MASWGEHLPPTNVATVQDVELLFAVCCNCPIENLLSWQRTGLVLRPLTQLLFLT